MHESQKFFTINLQDSRSENFDKLRDFKWLKKIKINLSDNNSNFSIPEMNFPHE